MSESVSFIRLPEVKQITGLSRSSIYLRIEEGTFPRQIALGGRAVAWIDSEIRQWVSDRIAQSRPTGADSHHEIFRKMENQTLAEGTRR